MSNWHTLESRCNVRSQVLWGSPMKNNTRQPCCFYQPHVQGMLFTPIQRTHPQRSHIIKETGCLSSGDSWRKHNTGRNQMINMYLPSISWGSPVDREAMFRVDQPSTAPQPIRGLPCLMETRLRPPLRGLHIWSPVRRDTRPQNTQKNARSG